MTIALLDVVLFSTYFLLLFLSIFWLLVLFTSKNEENETKQPWQGELPLFSVLIPAYNEEGSILETLTSVTNLDYPKEKLQVIVINDGSKDNTQNIIENFIKSHSENNITLINQQNKGKGAALNMGLKQATGKFFACLDADSFISPNGIKAMIPYFQNETVAAVCPLLKVKKPENVLQKIQWHEYVVNMFYKHLNSQLDCIHVTPGPFSVYDTKLINNLGGYDEKTITEDLELAIRIQKHHGKIIQTFDATVETVAPNTWSKLFWQRVRWYKGSVDNTIRYKKLMFNKKYGDFGMVRMPTIILSGAIAILLTSLLVREAFTKLLQWYHALASINFDIITHIKSLTFSFNFLSLPFGKMFIASTLIVLSFFVMIYSYRLINEKITNYGRTWIALVSYITIYGLFITGTWTYIAFMFIRKKKNFWG